MALEFTPQEVVAGVSLLRYGSAPGADGWTFRLIATILRDENAGSALVQRVTLFLNSFLDMSIDISIRKLFATCRLVMLPKEDHTLRPIGIGECWYRFVGTLASKLLSKDVGLQRLPIQMSVGFYGHSSTLVDSNGNVIGNGNVISKRNAYRQELGPRATFVPIVLESTGRFGEAAMEFVRKQAGKRYHLLSKLFSECPAAMAYYNAATVEKTRYLVRRRRDPEDRNIPPAYLQIHQPEVP